MNTSRLTLTCMLFTLLAALPAIAGPRTFVSGLGNDANPGTREQPKRTFASALTVTNPGGQIVALDSAGYASSTLTIDKSVSIIVPPGVAGFITVSGSNGIAINAAATDVVSIRGLIIETSASSSGSGIVANSVGPLSIEDCTVRNFAEGILFNPTNRGRLGVHDTTVRGCVFGIFVRNGGSALSSAVIDRARLSGNDSGLFAYAQPSGSSVDVNMTDCIVTGGNSGIVANRHSNAISTLVRVNNCIITDNNNGVVTFGGAQILSRGNNTLERNTNGNDFAGSYSPK